MLVQNSEIKHFMLYATDYMHAYMLRNTVKYRPEKTLYLILNIHTFTYKLIVPLFKFRHLHTDLYATVYER